jgi:hypothetical protein
MPASGELEVRRRTIFMFDRSFMRFVWADAALNMPSIQAWEEHVETLLETSLAEGQKKHAAQQELEELHRRLLPLAVDFYTEAERMAVLQWQRSGGYKQAAAHLSGPSGVGCERVHPATGETYTSSWTVGGLDGT